MKNLSYALLVLTGLLFGSCCTMIDCTNAFELREIKISGFTLEESENVLISSYEKGSQFKVFVDSATTSSRSFSGGKETDLFLVVTIEFTAELDYEVVFRNTNTVYRITDIILRSEKCNTCVLASDNYLVLNNYKINDVQKASEYFEIEK